ncbi:MULTISPECIES: MtrAB system histidine kinase MtrB [Streptomyces]|uniref:MtrAB system histidine kinase MtrB n=1 Tax=Streptomyces TaxID=1883 RepID=UPI001E4EBE28|nr:MULTISPECIES: MtrAB system histidine kinase MtrB [Streptomyces]UFQ16007.1 HAMP domain-containing protein [Streptomyces huasconensis]WCL85610.1 MtrAB system histidine kinase MtrB [Streptomyces sp. JCM 35825]
MSRDSSSTASGNSGARSGRTGPARRASRFGRLVDGGLLLQGGVQGSPVLRLFVRWVRRPLLPAVRLWRRNIQLKVVVTTLLMSLGVVLMLGFAVLSSVNNGLLKAKVKASQSQADGGFRAAQDSVNAARQSTEQGQGQGQDGGALDGRNAAVWMSDLVEQLSSGGQNAFAVVTLTSTSDAGSVRGSRASGGVEPILSVPEELRGRVDKGTEVLQANTRIVYDDGREPQPGLVIGKRLNDLNGDPYQLYYLFPLTQEEESLNLVRTTLATAGLFVVVLLGAIAWLVVRQVVTPVRMAAGIAERLSAGRLQERMKVTGEDDIARLGEAFNKMAQNLQLKIQQLEELSRMQRRFVSDVSHELRTPLTTVRMAADVIHEARVDFDPVTARSAELLADQLDRFESLLADLLEISRFDAGAAALEAEAIDLREVVRRVVGGAEMLAERKGTHIRVVGDQQPVVAEADARRVERVLRNLVVNAVEHGEGKDVVVRLAAAGGAVAVAVRDYGVGLKPGEATRVFSRFWRADPARARTTGGTGLGLSIALEDARLHGGWLQAWGEPGGGSQFRLTLPRTADEPLRGSPIPLEPEDSRRHRGLNDAGLPVDGGNKLATVPAQGSAATERVSSPPVPAKGPIAPRLAQAGAVDPTALPGSGARVVSRRPVDDEPESDLAGGEPQGDVAGGEELRGDHGAGAGQPGPGPAAHPRTGPPQPRSQPQSQPESQPLGDSRAQARTQAESVTGPAAESEAGSAREGESTRGR